MSFWRFSVATIIGSALWCSVLAWVGAKAYQVQPDLISNVDGWVAFVKTDSHWIVLFVRYWRSCISSFICLTSTKRKRVEPQLLIYLEHWKISSSTSRKAILVVIMIFAVC